MLTPRMLSYCASSLLTYLKGCQTVFKHVNKTVDHHKINACWSKQRYVNIFSIFLYQRKKKCKIRKDNKKMYMSVELSKWTVFSNLGIGCMDVTVMTKIKLRINICNNQCFSLAPG